MDLITLDETDNKPAKLVQGYDSLIWTERFNTVGDFRLVTSRIEETLELLPEDTRVSLRDSRYTQIVETHLIERKKGQPAKLVVTGRSFESVLDRRVAIQSVSSLTGTGEYARFARTPAQAAQLLIQDICTYGIVDPQDAFPTSLLFVPQTLEYSPIDIPPRKFTIARGNLLDRVLELLQTEGTADITTNPPTPATRQYGIITERPASENPLTPGYWGPFQIRIFDTRNVSDKVYFDARRELLDDGTYLFSKAGSANVAYGVAEGIAAVMHEGETEPSGLDRRVKLIDATNSDIEDVSVLQQYMSQELALARETAIFDGSINPDLNPYKYGVDYYLGDIVKLQGDYGLNELARVTEYIRSEDATGNKAYPTLQTITS